jgi:uncharacterized protein
MSKPKAEQGAGVFSIPVSSLDAGGRTFHFPVRAAWMRGVLEGCEATAAGDDGELDVRVSKSGNDVVVHGTLKAHLVAPCARCLEPVRFTIDEAVSALMVPAAQVKAPDRDDYEFQSDEADTLPYDGETVVLDDLVKDELVLETPMIPLCREECPGISPGSPAASAGGGSETSGEKPIDPRLLPLLRLKQNTKE